MAPATLFSRKTDSTLATEPLDGDLSARRKACCTKAAKFILSNIGLCILVALYAVAGAFIFQLLEQTNEKEECIQASLSSFAYRRVDAACTTQSTTIELCLISSFMTDIKLV